MHRRKSCDFKEKDEKLVDGFPRRHSLAPVKLTTSLLPRRNSEINLREIQEFKKIEETKHSVLRRQYSTLCVPKTISERTNVGKSVTKVDSVKKADDLELPRIPSATPLPEEIRFADKFKDSEKFEKELQNGSYRPKRCWCFRCQLMFSMFKAGDDRLEMWGNYPCFRR